ncbi:MAG: hypothetical protein JW902_18930 [Syntrophaceae bacterium]|nr:hypothetical protein [Syntrophaceae bacterium]
MLKSIAPNKDLTELAGIGKDLAGKISEIVETGTLSQMEEIEKETPAELNKLIKIAGLGPKRLKTLNRELGVSDLKSLRDTTEKGKIHKLEGFGRKTEQSILENFRQRDDQKERIKLIEAEYRAEPPGGLGLRRTGVAGGSGGN